MNEVLAIPCGWWLCDDQVTTLVEAIHAECAA